MTLIIIIITIIMPTSWSRISCDRVRLLRSSSICEVGVAINSSGEGGPYNLLEYGPSSKRNMSLADLFREPLSNHLAVLPPFAQSLRPLEESLLLFLSSLCCSLLCNVTWCCFLRPSALSGLVADRALDCPFFKMPLFPLGLLALPVPGSCALCLSLFKVSSCSVLTEILRSKVSMGLHFNNLGFRHKPLNDFLSGLPLWFLSIINSSSSSESGSHSSE